MSVKDSSDEAPPKKKRKKKVEGNFEIFYERSKEMLDFQDPSATEEDVKKYLIDLWENMKEEDRCRYRADYMPSDDIDRIRADYETEYRKETEHLSANKSSRKIIHLSTKNSTKQTEILYVDETASIVSSDSSDRSISKRKWKEKPDISEKIDIFEFAIENLARSRSYNLFKGTKQEKVSL